MAIVMTLFKDSKETNVRTDLDTTENLFSKLKTKKKVELKVVDTNGMSNSKLMDLYSKAIAPSVFNKYRIRTIFGTNRQSGIFFGKEQPALLVEGDIWDIYPHERNGKKITIEKFLMNILKATD